MIYFPALFVQALILGALILTGLSAITLLVMVLIDFLRKRVW